MSIRYLITVFVALLAVFAAGGRELTLEQAEKEAYYGARW